MRWTQSFIMTQREAPQDAEIRSHQLMVKASLIHKLSSGLYTYLPLGLRSLRKVEAIIRDRMSAHGAEELLMPILQPPELWHKTGRWDTMRELMLVAKDRQERDFVLGPTHEETITDLISKKVKSYRDLPRNLYQIQTKFRDEIRPRFGLMRAREFVMKDGYSFDVSQDAAQKTYWEMYQAYKEIFKLCGLEYKVVEADTGVMGGSLSHEYMVIADSGEDEIFSCTQCGYAANRELARKISVPNVSIQNDALIEEVMTPNIKTVQEVCAFLKFEPSRLIKTLLYESDKGIFAVLCRGDAEINESKLKKFLEIEQIALADDLRVEDITGAPTGFSGPVGLKGIAIYADESIRDMVDAVTGANKLDTHLLHVSVGRDFSVDSFIDLSYARKGDLCAQCNVPMHSHRGIEVGHVFYLGTKYSTALGAQYLDEKGQSHPVCMGCFGIGVSRTVAAYIEQNSDDAGIIWNPSLAPFELVIIPVNTQDSAIYQPAEQIYNLFMENGLDVIIDDRDERAGVKFKDADLIGFPFRITVGKKYLETGCVEIKNRKTGDIILSKKEDIIKNINNMKNMWK
ncbi:MAG: proline--tRNA ligase [Chlamydiota bacterium]|nr:proline--tRNA ligase [Chlamydiota bacterium]